MTNWKRVIHMYGRATDTPEYLEALTSTDVDQIEAAHEHLTSAIVHQETASMAAAPTLTWILAALAEGTISHPRAQGAVVDFLAELAAAAQGAFEAYAPTPKELLDQLEALENEQVEAYLEDEGFELYELTYDSTGIAIQQLKQEVLATLGAEPWRSPPSTAAAVAAWEQVPS